MSKRSWSMKDRTIVSLTIEKEMVKQLRYLSIENERNLCAEIRFILKQFLDLHSKEVKRNA